MKRIAKLTLVALFISGLAFTSCKKYEEGPAISLRTKTARLTGTWEVEKTIVNGEESTDDMNTEITIEKDGTGEVSMEYDGQTMTTDIEWEFGDKKESLKVRTKDMDGAWDDWEESDILRLTNDECWLLDDSDGEEIETHLKKI